MSEIAILNKENYKKAEMIGAYRYLDTASLTENFIDKYINLNGKENNIPSRARRQVEPNDILISTVRPTQKHFGIIEQPVQNLVVSTGFVTITPNSQLVNPYYLYILLTQEKVTNYLQVIAENSTSAYPSIKPRVIADLEFKFPKREIQDKIANLYKAIERKIKVNYQINDNLEQQVQAIFKSWFIDFEPFSNGDFLKTELGNIPVGWRVGSLGGVANITSGKRPPIKVDIKTDACQIPLVGASSIMGYTSSALYSEPILVIGRVGTHGITQRISDPCWPSDNTLVIKSPYYEFIFIQLQRVDYRSMNRGSTQPLITQTDMKNVLIVIPPDEILIEFEANIRTIMQLWESNLLEIIKLKSLRDTLLPKLISGEIDVSDIDV